MSTFATITAFVLISVVVLVFGPAALGVTLDASQDLDDGPDIATDGGTANFAPVVAGDGVPHVYNIDDTPGDTGQQTLVDFDMDGKTLSHTGAATEDITINALSLSGSGDFDFTVGSNVARPDLTIDVTGALSANSIVTSAGVTTAAGDVSLTGVGVTVTSGIDTSSGRGGGDITIIGGAGAFLGGAIDTHSGPNASNQPNGAVTISADSGITLTGGIDARVTGGAASSQGITFNGGGVVSVAGVIDVSNAARQGADVDIGTGDSFTSIAITGGVGGYSINTSTADTFNGRPAGDVTLIASGDITLAGGVNADHGSTAQGDLTIDAGGSIFLGSLDMDLLNDVTLTFLEPVEVESGIYSAGEFIDELLNFDSGTLISVDDFDVFYDPDNPANAYLGGGTFALDNGGNLTPGIFGTGSAGPVPIVPEPATILLAAMGLAGMAWRGWRRRR